MDSIASILLRITGDNDDAQQALRELQAELAAFAGREYEAEAKVDTDKGRLDQLRAELREFARTYTARARVVTEGSDNLRRTNAALQEFDQAAIRAARDTGGWTAALREMNRQMMTVNGRQHQLIRSTQRIGGARVYLGRYAAAWLAIKGAATVARTAMMAGIRGALLPGAAAAGMAAGALGGMGVAAGAASLVLKGLGGVFQNTWGAVEGYNQAVLSSGKNSKAAQDALAELKATVGQGGAVAAQAAKTYNQFSMALSKAIKPAQINMWRAMNDAYKAALQVLPEYARQVNIASREVAGFFKWVNQAPRINQMNATLRAMTGLWGPLGSVVRSVAQILLNIAQAAMPHLVTKTQQLSVWLAKLSQGALSVDSLRQKFATWMPYLDRAITFVHTLHRILVALFRIVAPLAADFQRRIQRIADDLLKWMQSKQARDDIQRFLQTAVPLFDKIVRFVGHVAKLFIAAWPAIGPVINAIVTALDLLVQALTPIARAVSQAITQLQRLGPVGQAMALVLSASFLGILGLIKGLIGPIVGLALRFVFMGGKIRALAAVFGLLGGAARAGVAAVIGALARIPGVKTVTVKVRDLASGAINRIGAAFGRLPTVVAAPLAILSTVLAGFWLRDVIQAAEDAVAKAANSLSKLPNAAKSAIDTIAALPAQAPHVAPAWQSFGLTLQDSMRQGVASGRSGLTAAAAANQRAAENVFRRGQPRLRPIGALGPKHASAGMRSSSGLLRTAGNYLGQNATTGFSQKIQQGANIGRKMANGFMSGLRSQSSRANNAGQAIARAAVAGFRSGGGGRMRTAGTVLARAAINALRTGARGARDAGRAIGAAATSGLSSTAGRIRSAGVKGARGAIAGLRTGIRGSTDAGKGMGDGAAKGILSQHGKIRQTANRGGVAAIQGFKAGGREARSVGQSIAQGIAAGINAGLPAIRAAATRAAAEALRAAKARLRSRSPSREFMEVGQSIPEGMAIGIASATGRAVNAAKQMAARTIRAAGGVGPAIRDAVGANVGNLRARLALERTRLRSLKGDERKTGLQRVHFLEDAIRGWTRQFTRINRYLATGALHQVPFNAGVQRGSSASFPGSPVARAPYVVNNMNVSGGGSIDHVQALALIGQGLRHAGIA